MNYAHLFRNNPLILPAVFLLVGILLNEYADVPVIALVVSGLVAAIIILICHKPWSGRWQPMVFLVSMACVFTGLGAIRHDAQNMEQPGGLENIGAGKVAVRGVVIRMPVKSGNMLKTHIQVDSIRIADSWYPTEGRMFLKSRDTVLLPGSTTRIEAEGYIRPVPDTGDAGFLSYCRRNGYTHSMFVWKVAERGYENSLMAWCTRTQDTFTGRISSLIAIPAISGLVSAMMLGDTRGITEDIRMDFSQTGLSHILAISGAHVALIYAMLLRVLGYVLPGTRFFRLRQGILLVVLLLYGAVSGGSPAVSRACIMISCYIVARIFWQRTHAANLLAAGMIGQLLWDPNAIFNIGFQLSYAAVSGILLLATPIQQHIISRFPKIPSYFPETLGMSIAAQLFTTPLILVHFGQFPTWFLLANLVVIPVGNLVIYLGFAFLVLMWVPIIGNVTAMFLSWLVQIMCTLTSWVAGLPFALMDSQESVPAGMLMIALQVLVVTSVMMMLRLNRKKLLSSVKAQWLSLPIFTPLS